MNKPSQVLIAALFAFASVTTTSNAALLTPIVSTQSGGLSAAANALNSSAANFSDGGLILNALDFFKNAPYPVTEESLQDAFQLGSMGLAVTIRLPDNIGKILISGGGRFSTKVYSETTGDWISDNISSNQHVFNIADMKSHGELDGTGRFTFAVMNFGDWKPIQIQMTDTSGNPVSEPAEPLNPFSSIKSGEKSDFPLPDGTINGFKCFEYSSQEPMTSFSNPMNSSVIREVNKPLLVLKKTNPQRDWIDCRGGLVVNQAGAVQILGWNVARLMSAQSFRVFDTVSNTELTKPGHYTNFFVFFAKKPGIYPMAFLLRGNVGTKLFVKRPEDSNLQPMKVDEMVIRRELGDPAPKLSTEVKSSGVDARFQDTQPPSVQSSLGSVGDHESDSGSVSCECPIKAVINGESIKSCKCKM